MSTITQSVITSIEQLKQEGRTIDEICLFTGRTSKTVAAIISGRHMLQTWPPESKNALRHRSREAIVAIVGERTEKYVGRGKSFNPTPEQIEAACLAIRKTWSEAERYSRSESTPTDGPSSVTTLSPHDDNG